jgi:hypothetical protein
VRHRRVVEEVEVEACNFHLEEAVGAEAAYTK